MIKVLIISLFLFLSVSYSQTEEWIKIYEGPVSKLYIDISKINSFKGDEFFVWAKAEIDPPMIIESVPGKIYKYRTYYLFSKKLKKYSIVSIIYYDKNGNVLKSFNYNINSKVESLKFSYPIIKDSDEEKIFNSCLAIMKTKSPNLN